MLDDFDVNPCEKKHYGPVLYVEGEFAVMRCSFCEQLFLNPVNNKEEKPRSSRTCISACDWVTEGRLVKCLSCSYSGPAPVIEEQSDKEPCEFDQW
jgi:hypothetical protein